MSTTQTQGQKTNAIALRAKAGEPGAIDELLAAVEKLIWRQALRYANRRNLPESDLDDLVQAGRIAILPALRTWRPEQATFNTCYVKWLIQAFQRAALEFQTIRIPAHFATDPKYRAAHPGYADDAARVEGFRASGWDRRSDADGLATIPAPEAPDDAIERRERVALIRANLDCLTDRQRQVLDLLYLKDRLDERTAAKVIGTTKTNVNEVKRNACAALRRRLETIQTEASIVRERSIPGRQARRYLPAVYLSAGDLAVVFGVCRMTVNNWWRLGHLPYVTLEGSRHRRITPAQLEGYVRANYPSDEQDEILARMDDQIRGRAAS